VLPIGVFPASTLLYIMAKDPAFLFYSQDWIVGALTLTMEERGQYITIIAQMHQQGRMDEKTIRFLVGNVSDNLKTKFKIDKDGKWFNERLELETSKRNKFTASRRENGAKGGRPKKKPLGLDMDNHMGNEDEDVNNNKGIPTFEEFKSYALEKKPKINLEHLRNKYDAWVVNGWKDGNDKDIKNWKSKLLQTLPHMKEDKEASKDMGIRIKGFAEP